MSASLGSLERARTQLLQFLRAIRIAHRGRYSQLDDAQWLEYGRAMSLIATHCRLAEWLYRVRWV